MLRAFSCPTSHTETQSKSASLAFLRRDKTAVNNRLHRRHPKGYTQFAPMPVLYCTAAISARTQMSTCSCHGPDWLVKQQISLPTILGLCKTSEISVRVRRKTICKKIVIGALTHCSKMHETLMCIMQFSKLMKADIDLLWILFSNCSESCVRRDWQGPRFLTGKSFTTPGFSPNLVLKDRQTLC